MIEARTNRHITDYSPYDVQRDPPRTDWVGITPGNWTEAAKFNRALAEVALEAAVKFIGS